MLRIGLCDDSAEARFALRCALERILERRAVESALYEFSSGDRLMDWYGKHTGELELIFLDIEMEGANGMETAKHLRDADKNLQIVFVTGYPDFVFDGYAVGALGYLMKPPDQTKLDDILTRAMAALHLGAGQVYLCRNSEGMYRIPRASIRYFCSEKRKVTCVADSRSYTFYARLDDVAGELGDGFVRIHQRYLVNAAAVERVNGDEVEMAGGETLPVSRAHQKDAMLALTRAMLRGAGSV